MEQGFGIMILCHDLEINFLQSVFWPTIFFIVCKWWFWQFISYFLPLKRSWLYCTSLEINAASLALANWIESKLKKNVTTKKTIFSVTTMTTWTTSNCYNRQTIWQKLLKFWYKKRQTICYKRKKRKNHNIDCERHTINLE